MAGKRTAEEVAHAGYAEHNFSAGCRVFDVFKTWRLDSGDYAEVAEVVVAAWERRYRQLESTEGPKGVPAPCPALMHSNLSDVDHVLQVAK